MRLYCADHASRRVKVVGAAYAVIFSGGYSLAQIRIRPPRGGAIGQVIDADYS
jgi:hypothetical protein